MGRVGYVGPAGADLGQEVTTAYSSSSSSSHSLAACCRLTSAPSESITAEVTPSHMQFTFISVIFLLVTDFCHNQGWRRTYLNVS